MKYIITDRLESLDINIKNEFIENYSIFIKENISAKFDSILRSSLYISILAKDNNLVGFCFHRKIDMNQAEYLNKSPEFFKKYIEEKFNVFSVEWLTVAKKYRGVFTKYQPADLLIGLSLKSIRQRDLGFDSAMGFSRMDIKTDQISTRMGSRSFGTVEIFGLPCSLVFCESYSVKDHPIAKVQLKIDQIYEDRVVDLKEQGLPMHQIKISA